MMFDRKDIATRQLTGADIPDAMLIKNAAGWNQLETDWLLCLELDAAGCRVATHFGQVMGTGAALLYDGRVSWIGMVLVDAAFRRGGVATTIMQELLRATQPGVVSKLDASAAGQAVYEKIGFVAEYGVTRMRCANVPALPDGTPGVQPLDVAGLAWAVQQDATAFGVSRPGLLRHLQQRLPETAWRTSEAFCMGRTGWHSFQVGPVVAANLEAAVAVVAAALRNLHGRSVILDVPDAQRGLRTWLSALGFVEERRFMRMFRGQNEPGRPEHYFAAAGAEFG